MPTVKVNDISLYYEIHGKGEPLVLVMGLGTDISEWKTIIDPLSKKYKVLVFDNRGAGRSDKPDEPYTIKLMASDAAGVIKAAGFEPANVLGISMGGAIALELTLNDPDLIKKLILVSTAARFIKRQRTSWLGFIRKLPLFVSKYPQPKYAYDRQHSAVLEFNCTKRLSELKLPVLILHGQKDKTVPLYLAEELHAGIKNSRMTIFKGGHLFLLIRQRQKFLDKVSEFIA